MAGPFKLDNGYANYAGHWLSATAYALGKRVIAESTNAGNARKYVFECTTAGTSADPGPPTWVITPGNTTSDGTVTWTCREATTWANAHGRTKWIALRVAAGEIIHVDDGHAETPPTTELLLFNGTKGNPVRVIVVDKSTDNAVSNYPASALIDYGATGDGSIQGHVYFWGMYLIIGDDLFIGLNTMDTKAIFEKSKLKFNYISSIIDLQSYNSDLKLIDTYLEFVNTGAYIYINSRAGGFEWIGGTLAGNVTNLIKTAGYYGGGIDLVMSGVDLSSMAGGNIINNIGSYNVNIKALLSGIKLNASPAVLFAGTALGSHGEILMDIADNGSTVYKFRREYQYGYAQDETIKVITGKALYDGTNEFTAKMVSRATPTPTFYDPWRYHLTTLRETGFAASRTYTVHIAQDHASVQPDALDNDEIWLEVVYPDNGTAQYNIKTDKIATPTTTPAAQTTSTETWEGLLSTTRLQELSVQIDAADGKNGPVEIWVCLAKESKTVYVCPEVYVS